MGKSRRGIKFKAAFATLDEALWALLLQETLKFKLLLTNLKSVNLMDIFLLKFGGGIHIEKH